MILFQIPKFDFVFSVKKFEFQNFQAKQRIHIGFLKNLNLKRKQAFSNFKRILGDLNSDADTIESMTTLHTQLQQCFKSQLCNN
jgi:hypothetical protein